MHPARSSSQPPHLVLLSERWNNHTGKKTSQKTLNLINDAVLDVSSDGHPVRFLVASARVGK